MIIPSRPRAPVVAAVVAAVAGTLVAWRIERLGLTLTHYDARGHLVVARRIFDSVTPGWQQIGAVWLPLPHLLNAIPVQLDLFYRTGASAIAISVLSFSIAVGAIVWIVQTMGGSTTAALAAAAGFALNPNLLYLQATPMTEPLLLALTTLAVALLIDWCRDSPTLRDVRSRRTGWAFALACLTRYEAWPVTCCALAAAVWATWRSGRSLRDALRRVAGVGLFPSAAILGFIVFSRIVIGEWFVSSGFFVADNDALGRPMKALAQIGWGLRATSGPLLVLAGAAGMAALVALGSFKRDRAVLMIPVALAASALLPLVAFVDGHPYRIRYMIPLLAAESVCAGIAAGLAKRRVAVFALCAAILLELRPLSLDAPMVVEAQWDRPNIARRRDVTEYLRAQYGGETVMASMGSLGHYMQELSRSGLAVGDFLHEGNGDIWLNALDGPRPYAGWVLIEEQAEGGDMLAQIARKNPKFLDGFSRVAEGAGLALYRREPIRGLGTSPAY